MEKTKVRFTKKHAIILSIVLSVSVALTSILIVVFTRDTDTMQQLSIFGIGTENTPYAISREYDGTVYYKGELLVGIHYNIALANQNFQSQFGYDVNITIVKMRFNDANVLYADQLFVYFSSVLTGASASMFSVVAGHFTVPARITPRVLEITPPNFVREFEDVDNLEYEFYDEYTSTLVQLDFLRQHGENIGAYDILAAYSHNSNFAITIIGGYDRFQIVYRILHFIANPEIAFARTFNNSRYYKNLENLDFERYFLLQRLPFGFTVNIKIVNIVFEDVNAGQTYIAVYFAADYNGHPVRFQTYNFLLPAYVLPRVVYLSPTTFVKEFGDTYSLAYIHNYNCLGLQVEVLFERQKGMLVGSYDIVNVLSSCSNFEARLVGGSGAGRFVINRRLLAVVPTNILVQRAYSGNNLHTQPLLQGVHYIIQNTLYGFPVEIQITSTFFNSQEVASATSLIVHFSANLIDNYGVYRIEMSYFVLNAQINRRILQVTPPRIEKQFGDVDRLNIVYLDDVTNRTVSILLQRQQGESVGVYNILSGTTTNNNFTIQIIGGQGRFVILHGDVVISAQDRVTVFNGQPQTIDEPTSAPSILLIREYWQGSQRLDSTPINAGQYTVRIIFEGDANYNATYIERSLIIERADAIITNTTPAYFTFSGQAHLPTATLNHSETEIEFSISQFINVGIYTVMIISNQTLNFSGASIIISVSVNRLLIASINFPTASSITFGQNLYNSVLTGGSINLGTFEWRNGSATPTVAQTSHTVIFIPSESSFTNLDLSQISFEQQVTVVVHRFIVQSIPTPTAPPVSLGSSLNTSALSQPSSLGIFIWSNPTFLPTNSGNQPATFIPLDEANNDFTLIQRTVQVHVTVAFLLRFVTNGADEIADMFLLSLNSFPTVHRNGYVFEGWFLDAGFNNRASVPMSLVGVTMLHAAWRPVGLSFTRAPDNLSYIVRSSGEFANTLIIPSLFRGLPVTQIADEGFANQSSLTSITIPQSVHTIGNRAFLNTLGLLSINIFSSQYTINLGTQWNHTNNPRTDIFFAFD
ncbi:MAG: leucine-rich repeat domain-containing protein [Firmicutes bacterium]|nr:leucine-rich repeat domain-containing protein [Bacillota bacterium]